MICADWFTDDELVDCECPDGSEAVVTSAVTAASEWMYEATGRRWPGVCETTEKPCGCPTCDCTGPLCTCATTDDLIEVTYGPVLTATVTIDGAAFTAFQIVYPNRLLRIDGESWPTCQSYRSGLGFQVVYTHGVAPPELAKRAAIALAGQIIRSCTGQACRLPAGTTSVNRRGVSIDLDPDQAANALTEVAMALSAYPTQTSQPDVRIARRRGLVTAGPDAP